MRSLALRAIVTLVALLASACGRGDSTPVPSGTVTDGRGRCRMALSSDFAHRRSRDGAANPFPASNGASFADLTSATGVPLDRALRDGIAAARGLVTDLREHQFGPITGTKSLRLDFTGARGGQAGSGAVHVREFDGTVCTITFFVAQGSGIAYDATLQRAISSLQPVRR